ncbi:hypothetical protein [Moritella sp.]|uniref:hypothetical protein n=1 Tax=Moritella sp. TaxID=78556 RepID=UPI0025FE0548|nr:hypothetical protein [Moritella sp.]
MRPLKLAGMFTLTASFLHIAIIFGGADWYRFFGAGEEMATMSEQGSIYPSIITSIIVLLLAISSIYAISGAGVIRKVPFLKTILSLLTFAFLTRGLIGIPLVLFASSDYMTELATDMTFMIISSLICVLIGSCYGLGVLHIYSAKS